MKARIFRQINNLKRVFFLNSILTNLFISGGFIVYQKLIDIHSIEYDCLSG